MTKVLYKYKGGNPMTATDKIDYTHFILRDYICAGLSEKALKRRYKAVHPDTIKYILYSGIYKDTIRFLQDLNRLKFENKFRMEAL